MPTIFVSYSHIDRKWLDPAYPYALIPWLENMLRRDAVTLWYDRSDRVGLQAGDEFHSEILNAIDAAQVALLLVSEAFFASDFIQSTELPRILQRADAGELVVIPILLEPCDWRRFTYVASRQMLPGDPTPLIDYTSSDREWSHALYLILSGVRRRLSEDGTPAKQTGVTTAAPSAQPGTPAAAATPVQPTEASPASQVPLSPLAPASTSAKRARWLPYAIAVAIAGAILLVAGISWMLGRGSGAKTPGAGAVAAPVTQAPAAMVRPATPVATPSAIPTRPAATAAAGSGMPTQSLPAATPAPTLTRPAPGTPSPGTSLPAVRLSPANAASMTPLAYRSKDRVSDMAWLPGRLELLFSGSNLVAYDPATRQERKVAEVAPGALAVAKGAGGVPQVAGSGREALQIWNADSGAELALFPDLKNARNLALSPDGSLLAAGIDTAVKLMEVPGGREVNTLLGVVGQVERVAFSPDGKTLAGAGTNVVLWNVADGSVLAKFPASNWVTGLGFSPDGATLAVGARGGLTLYDVTRIESLRPRLLRTISDPGPVEVAWSPDGALLAWTASPALVQLWDVAAGRQVATLKGHTSDVTGLGFSPDGTLLATTASDGMRLWGAGVAGQASPTLLPAAAAKPSPVPLSPAAISAANAGRVVQLDLWKVAPAYSRQMVWSPDGSWLAGGSAQIYDVVARQARSLDPSHAVQLLAAAPAPGGLAGGGPMLATSSSDLMRIWDVKSGAELAAFADLKSPRCMVLAPDGSLLAVGLEKAVKLLQVPGGREIDTLLGVDGSVERVTFSPDGKTVAAAGTIVMLWNVADGSVLANFQAGNWVTGLAFSPDGATLAVGTNGGLKLYDATHIESLRPRLLRTISDDKQVEVAWSPDGTLLAWTASPALVKLWDVAAGREVASLSGHTGRVTSLAFSPDGARLASLGDDGAVRLWGVGK